MFRSNILLQQNYIDLSMNSLQLNLQQKKLEPNYPVKISKL